jgi:hypothetical protein
MPLADADQRATFTRQFELRSRTPWCRITQSSVSLHSEQSAKVLVEYDATQLTEPGLHVGIVEAVADGQVEFRLLSSIIVPHRFTAEGNFAQHFRSRVVKGWTPDRYFLAVPPGASVMRLVLAAPSGATSRAGFDRIFTPEGKELRTGGKRLDSDNGLREAEWVLSDKLVPGVWEVPITADRPDRQWPYDLTVQFYGLCADPVRITTGPATKPKGEITVTNLFEKPVAATADGQIEGFRQQKDDKFKGLKDELTYSVTLGERFKAVRLNIEMTPESFGALTDVGVLVKDSEGEELYAGAMDNRQFETTVETKGKKSVDVVIKAGFAQSDDQRETPVTVRIDTLLATPVPIKITQGGEANVQFVPSLPVKLEYAAEKKLEDIPSGQKPVGFLRFRERSSEDVLLRVPVEISK